MRGRFFGRRRRKLDAGTTQSQASILGRRDARPTARPLVVEPLEDRRLLTTTSDLSNLTLEPGSHRAGSLLVQFRDGASSAGSLAAYQVTANVNDEEWSITPGLRRVEIDADADWEATLAAYQQDPNVLYAQADHRVSLQLVPDDPFFDVLYAMDNTGQGDGLLDADIDAVEAWDVTTGSRDTIVAVIDTGVDYNHPDLAANMWTNENEIPGNRIDDDKNGFVDDIHGYDFVSNDGNPMDDHYHGTHVAGTIGAVGNNGIGVTGVNWQVSIMALKFLDADGFGYESDAIAALNYAVANGAVISNNSWGGGGFSSAMFSAIENARAKGHIFVAAAGNDGWNNDLDPFYPASYKLDNIVSVAATDDNDELAWFSNFGATSVDLAAPGVNIHSTAPGGQYRDLSGTSMATPHVTGVIALVRSQHPSDWTYRQVIDKVLGSADPVDGALKTITGGRLNAANAVGAPDLTGPRVVSTDPSNSVAGTVDHVRLNFSEAIDPQSIGIEDVISLTGPDGPIEIASVALSSSSSRSVDVTFSPQSVLGTYSLSLGVNISDLAGNLIDQDRDRTGGEDPDDAFSLAFEITDIIAYHSDPNMEWGIDNLDFAFSGQPTTSTITVAQNIAIDNIDVQVATYYWELGELRIYLESPSGTRVTLVRQEETYGQWLGYAPPAGEILYATFDDEASTPIQSGSSPYLGTYRPSSPLSAFNGENANGTWTLAIEAHINWADSESFLNGQGTLFSWGMTIGGDGSGNPPPPPPPPPPPDGNSPPVAVDDQLEGEVNTTLAITPADLLANDTDVNGDQLSFYGIGINVVGGSVGVGTDGLITFTPQRDFEGLASFEYFVTDGFENSFDIGKVTIDFAQRFQWHNSELAADVDKDGEASPGDALFIINLLNAVGDGPLVGLSADTEPEAFIDVEADNYLAPGDALSVINFINSQPSPSPLSMSAPSTAAQSQPRPAEIDMALLIMLLESSSERAKR